MRKFEHNVERLYLTDAINDEITIVAGPERFVRKPEPTAISPLIKVSKSAITPALAFLWVAPNRTP
ncbi:MAG: hypothetical protein IH606_06565 [Burkholderiales bacterium]|nr:hypothetical protein [Burkholderiales bacterium]